MSRLRSLREGGYLFLCGVCMGASDLVPGVSGGTIAFIMGIYEEMIFSIRRFLKSWDFLAVLLSGVAFSLITFSHFIRRLLDDPILSHYLFAGFTGLILGSILFCAKQVGEWSLRRSIALLGGAAAAFLLTGSGIDSYSSVENPSPVWIAGCGAAAVSAMLLPGVSGSYLLAILGMYRPVIHALTDSVSSLRKGVWDPGMAVLLYLGVGIIGGALLFSGLIGWLLKKHRQMTIALLTGFMAGAIRAIWPFGFEENGKSLSVFWISLALGAAGFFLVVFLEWAAGNLRKEPPH